MSSKQFQIASYSSAVSHLTATFANNNVPLRVNVSMSRNLKFFNFILRNKPQDRQRDHIIQLFNIQLSIKYTNSKIKLKRQSIHFPILIFQRFCIFSICYCNYPCQFRIISLFNSRFSRGASCLNAKEYMRRKQEQGICQSISNVINAKKNFLHIYSWKL